MTLAERDYRCSRTEDPAGLGSGRRGLLMPALDTKGQPMATDDIALALLAGAGGKIPAGAVGWHTGVVTDWNEATGENTIIINGSEFKDLRVLSTSNSILLRSGDVVGILKVRTEYFVLGRVQAPGKGAALQWRTGVTHTFETLTGVPLDTYTDLPTVGPVVEDVYIGSSRRCLITFGAYIQCSNSTGYMSVEVSGASDIDPLHLTSAAFRIGANDNDACPTSGATVQVQRVLSADDGLHEGLNTFTAKYALSTERNGTGADFQERTISVMPF